MIKLSNIYRHILHARWQLVITVVKKDVKQEARFHRKSACKVIVRKDGPSVLVTMESDEELPRYSKVWRTYGVPSGPIIRALMISTRVSSTRKKMDESQAIGRFVVSTAS